MTEKVYLIGLGPGYKEGITPEAVEALNKCDVVISPPDAVQILNTDILKDKLFITDKMSPLKRSELAIEYAKQGKVTSIIALGHPGFFAIASSFFSVMENQEIDVEVISGMTMVDYATAKMGSPLGRDYAVVSLTDQASPWEEIRKRAYAALDGDFVVVIYNPIGKLGTERLHDIVEYAGTKGNYVIGLLVCVEFGDERVIISDLEHFPYADMTPATLVIIGNSYTINQNGRMITPRPYIEGVGY